MRQAMASFLDEAEVGELDAGILSPFVREQIESMTLKPAAGTEPVRALMRAMLQDAILCLLGEAASAPQHRPRLADEARQWFASPSRVGVFSFENVCSVLGFESGPLRRRLLDAAKSASLPTTEIRSASEGEGISGVRHLRKSRERRTRRIRTTGRRRRRECSPAA